MPARLSLFEDDDVTPLAPLIPPDIDGGTVETLDLWHLWNDLGGAFGDTVTASGIVVSAKVDDGNGEHTSGFPILDERWIGVQVTDLDNTGDSTMEAQTTPVVRIGAGASLVLKPIPKNCARYLQVTVSPPPGCANATYETFLEITVGDSSIVLPIRIGVVSGGGVIPDWQDASARRLTRGGALSATGTDVVGIANRSWVADGLPFTQTKDTETLNQNASDGALASGQKYVARISQPIAGGGVTVTKSVKGATPAKPAVPANEINLGCVNVLYDAGGTSVIVTANLDMADVLYGEYLVTDGGTLNARVGAGNAIASSDSGPFAGQSILVALADNDVNTVWLKPGGTPIANTTDVSPQAGSQRLAYVTTAGGVITLIEDARVFVGHALYDYVVELRKDGSFNATDADFAWRPSPPWDAAVIKITAEIGTLGTAASGSYKFDVTTRPPGTDLGTPGTTLFTNSGTDEQRPAIAFDATVLRAETLGHEVTIIPANSRIAADTAAVAATITVDPSDRIVCVYLRRLQ